MNKEVNTIILFCLLIIACSENEVKYKCLMPFSREAIMTERNSQDTLNAYFPLNTFLDSSAIKDDSTGNFVYFSKIDTFSLEWFSFNLQTMKEPILYSQYLGKEVYRFSWFRSFNSPVIITLEKDNDEFHIITKMTNRLFQRSSIKLLDFKTDMVTEIRDTTPLYLQINQRDKIDRSQYQTFTDILKQTDFTCLSPRGIDNFGIDGSEWIIEIHNKNGYYYVDRHSPEDSTPLRRLGEYLLDLSAAKNEKRY